MNQLSLLVTNCRELLALNKGLKSQKLSEIIEKLKRVENESDTTVVSAIKQYSRMFLILIVLNKPNKDTAGTKIKLCHSISMLFSIKPLIKKLLDDWFKDKKILDNNVIANTLTVVISFVMYPNGLKYQRNYLSVYLTIVALQLVLEKYTSFRHFWLLFPFTFAKIWEFYNINIDHCPKLAAGILNFFIKGTNKSELNDLRMSFIALPAFLLLNYKKTRSLKSKTPLLQTLRLTLVTLGVIKTAKALTEGNYFHSMNSKLRLQIIGLIASLPTVVYLQSNSLWLYLMRLVMISLNRKHSVHERSRLNRFKVDKILITASLIVILSHKDDPVLSKNKIISKLVDYIDNGKSLVY